MNSCRYFFSQRLGIVILGIIGFGAPIVVIAGDVHVAEMAKIRAAVITESAPVHAPDTREHVDETALTPQAVIAIDDHWSLAELRGNTAWLNSLLLPSYRSIRANGSVLDKKTLLAHASQNRGHGPEKLKGFDVWLKTHPMNESVIIHGHVSILSFSDPKTGRVRLSNVFVHEKGRWHALYSQLAKTDK